MKLFELILSTFLLAFFAAASPVDVAELQKREVQKPSVDPFYQPDAGYESYPVGTILRHRQLTIPTGSLVFAAKPDNDWN